MRIVELPFELCGGRVPALAFLAAREDAMQVGFQVWMGNGLPPGTPTGCIITLPDYVDDTLAIFVNGVAVKDDSLGLGADNLVHDLFALAAAVPLALNAGDRVELFAKDTLAVYVTSQPWTAVITFSDGRTSEISGGLYEQDAATYTYKPMGGFYLGWPAASQATTYFSIGSFSHFATPAVLLAEYPESALTLDNYGPVVQLTGVDNELDEADAFRALSNESLIFIGDEVMTLAGATLVGANTYQLKVVRQRFGTRKATHEVGAEVWLIARSDLQPVTHPAFSVGVENAFKVTLFSARHQTDLADVDPVGKQITGEPFVPSPRNLRVNGSSPALVSAAAAMTATWSLPENIDATGEGDFTYSTRVRFRVDDELVDERTVNAAFVNYSAAELATFWGAGGDFQIEIVVLATNEELQLASAAETLNGEAI
jgi:hypothetical protein